MTANAVDPSCKFRQNVYALLTEKLKMNHYPHEDCFKGKCGWCETTGYRWWLLRFVLKTFWKSAPDTNKLWRIAADETGFGSDFIQEIALGVFVGSDRPIWTASSWPNTMQEVR